MAEFVNPSNVHAPVGAYSHTVSVPPGTELIFISGQVGMRPDGSVPASFAEQTDVVFENIRACLAAHGLGMGAVVKLTSFLTPGLDEQNAQPRQRMLECALAYRRREPYLRGWSPLSLADGSRLKCSKN